MINRENARTTGISRMLERSTRTVGVYPVDTDTILALYQQRTGDVAQYSNEQIKNDERFNTAKFDAAAEFLTEELSLNGLLIKSVHINADFDRKLLYVELDKEKDVKTVFGRVAKLAKNKELGEDVKVINYFPAVVFERKNALLSLIRQKKLIDNNAKYQIRMGKDDIEVHKKQDGPEGPYRRIPLTDLTDDVHSLPKIGWQNRDYTAPWGRQVRRTDLFLQAEARNNQAQV